MDPPYMKSSCRTQNTISKCGYKVRNCIYYWEEHPQIDAPHIECACRKHKKLPILWVQGWESTMSRGAESINGSPPPHEIFMWDTK